MARRVFSKSRDSQTASIRVPNAMLSLLERLAEREGVSRNAFVVLALDEYLQGKAERHEVPWPEDYDPVTKKHKAA